MKNVVVHPGPVVGTTGATAGGITTALGVVLGDPALATAGLALAMAAVTLAWTVDHFVPATHPTG